MVNYMIENRRLRLTILLTARACVGTSLLVLTNPRIDDISDMIPRHMDTQVPLCLKFLATVAERTSQARLGVHVLNSDMLIKCSLLKEGLVTL